MKRIKLLTAIIVIFAIIAIFGGAYSFYADSSVFKIINGGIFMDKNDKGVVTANALTEQEQKGFEELKKELDEKYLSSFCDILSEAKAELIAKTEDLLGDEYKAKKAEIERDREDIKDLAKTLNESEEISALKDRLAAFKERLITSVTDEQRNYAKSQIQACLNELTQKNLDNFAALTKKKRELDGKINDLKDFALSKKDEVKTVEAEVVSATKDKVRQLVYSYGKEIATLANVFGVTEYEKTPVFVNKINPDLKLVEFDKEAFTEAYLSSRDHRHHHDHSSDGVNEKKHGCPFGSSCDKDCSACDDEGSLYKSADVDDNDN